MPGTGRSGSFTRFPHGAVAAGAVLGVGLLAAAVAGADGAVFSTNGLGKVLRYAGCALGIALASTFGAVAGAVLACFILLVAEVS